MDYIVLLLIWIGMLDNQLIESGTEYTQAVLSDLASNSLVLVTQVFSASVFDQLLDYCQKYDKWIAEKNPYAYDGGQAIQNRFKSQWEYDSIIEVTHNILENCTPELERIFAKPLEFKGLVLWKDTLGFQFDKHTDNPVFNASLQVYLQNLPHIVTQFEYNEQLVTPDPAPNCGYIADNTLSIPHWMPESVPDNFERYSLHATWA